MAEFPRTIKLQNALKDTSHLRSESTRIVVKNILSVILCSVICWALIASLVTCVGAFFKELSIRYDDLAKYLHSGDTYGFATNIFYLFALVFIVALFRGLLMSLPSWKHCEGGGLFRALKNFHASYKFEDEKKSKDITSKRYKNPTLTEAIKRVFVTFLTIAPSGSGGLEGPVFHVGESVGAFVAKVTKVTSTYDLRTLQICGIAASIGTLFNAPLTAALFSVEVIYTDRMMSRKIFYAMIAAWVVFNLNQLPIDLQVGFHYESKNYQPDWLDYLCVIFMSLLVNSPVGMIFFKIIDKITEISEKFSSLQKALIGSISCAIIVVVSIMCGINGHYVAGTGENVINSLLTHQAGTSLDNWHTLFLVLIFKIAATTLLIGFGGSAGLLFPTMFLGAVSGAVTFFFLSSMGLNIDNLELFVVAGITSVLTIIIESPLAALAFVFEIADPHFAPPIIIACAISHLFFKKKGLI
jgi:H+/Cl- antiporter ClcA